MRGKRTYGGRPGQRVEEQGTWAAQKHSEAGYGRPVDRAVWTAKTVKRPRQQPAHPQYAKYWAPLTRKRPIPPHSAQPRHTNHGALRTRKRHQREHRPQRPTESSDPTQHAKGRPGDCPGPRKGTTTRRNVTRGGHGSANANPAAPAARTYPNYRGTWEIVPFVNRTFEWAVVIATFLSVLTAAPRHCARLTHFLRPIWREISAYHPTANHPSPAARVASLRRAAFPVSLGCTAGAAPCGRGSGLALPADVALCQGAPPEAAFGTGTCAVRSPLYVTSDTVHNEGKAIVTGRATRLVRFEFHVFAGPCL